MTEAEWPYNLPIWRRFYRAQSPDGKHVAQIDPAYELTMGNPTWGILCISSGPHIERCNPSFVWSDDSRYLPVPQFYEFFSRHQLFIAPIQQQHIFPSNETSLHFH